MSFYQNLAEKLQFIFPEFYKKRFFKKLDNLQPDNFAERNVEPELIWAKTFLNPEDTFFDIGSNMGSFIFQLEDKLKPANIFAFEPNKALYKRLKRIFPKVNIFPFALSDSEFIADFKVPIISGKQINSRGTLQTNFKEENEENAITEKVQVKTFDAWFSENKIQKLSFIKIDVEGNEHQTLKGAEKSIKQFLPTLMVEIEQRHHDFPIWNIISEIENWGYQSFFLNRNTFQLEKLSEDVLLRYHDDVKNKELYINNIIFIAKER